MPELVQGKIFKLCSLSEAFQRVIHGVSVTIVAKCRCEYHDRPRGCRLIFLESDCYLLRKQYLGLYEAWPYQFRAGRTPCLVGQGKRVFKNRFGLKKASLRTMSLFMRQY